jgi:hypothetical protein
MEAASQNDLRSLKSMSGKDRSCRKNSYQGNKINRADVLMELGS